MRPLGNVSPLYVHTHAYEKNSYTLKQKSVSLTIKYAGPYDFRDAETTERTVESSHKNWIGIGTHSLKRNVSEFVKF